MQALSQLSYVPGILILLAPLACQLAPLQGACYGNGPFEPFHAIALSQGVRIGSLADATGLIPVPHPVLSPLADSHGESAGLGGSSRARDERVGRGSPPGLQSSTAQHACHRTVSCEPCYRAVA